MNAELKPIVVLGFLLVGGPVAGAGNDYLGLKKVALEQSFAKDGKRIARIELETGGKIPMDGKSGAFGYAALTDGGNNVLVTVTHLPIDDSSHEDPASGFHTHVLDLKTPTAACTGATFEVDVENSKKNAAFDANYAWKVDGGKLEVKNIPAADLGDAGVEGLAAFNLKPVLAPDGKPTNLCVTVVDQI